MTDHVYDYMHCPKESIETVRKFVNDGQGNGGEYSFVREELAELIRAVERYERALKIYSEPETGVVDIPSNIRDNLIEEIAHVYLVLNHLRYAAVVPLSFIQTKMDAKIRLYGFETYEEGSECKQDA